VGGVAVDKIIEWGAVRCGAVGCGDVWWNEVKWGGSDCKNETFAGCDSLWTLRRLGVEFTPQQQPIPNNTQPHGFDVGPEVFVCRPLGACMLDLNGLDLGPYGFVCWP
jgi:hypothetical protein